MRNRIGYPLALLAIVALLASSCGDDDGADEDAGPTIVVGAQEFGESIVLAQVYAQAMENAGFDTSVQNLSGFRDILLGAFESGDVNFSPEYAASLLEQLNGPDVTEATGDVEETVDILEGYLEDEELVHYEPAPGVDTNAFVMTREKAEELGIMTLSDLAEKGADLTLGGPSDCETNAFCVPGLERVYGVDFADTFVPLDDGRPDALSSGELDVAVLFSTDGIIAERDFVLLEDDMNLLAADNIIPIATEDVADAYGQDLADVVNSVSQMLTTETLTGFNQAYEIQARDASEIASEFLEENDL